MPLFAATPATTVPTPALHTAKGWSLDPGSVTGSQIISTGGTLQVVKVPVNGTQSISSAWVHVPTAGASLTNVGFTLHSAAGAQLATSINANGATTAAFTSTGIKQVTFTAQTVTDSVYVCFWFTGTTLPTLARGTNITVSNVLYNFNLAAPNLRFATANTGLTSTAPGTMGTQTAAVQAYWVAVS